VNRRDFLTFRVERRLRVAELSCERLYMLLLDVQLTGESHDAGHTSWNGGEPPALYERRSADDVFAQIDRDLNDVDVLRISDRDWLTAGPLASQLDRIVAQFRTRGGRIDI